MAGSMVHLGVYGRHLYSLFKECEWSGQLVYTAENEILLEFANNPDRARADFARSLRKFVESGRFVFYTHLSYDEMNKLVDHVAGKATADDAVIGAEHRLDPVMTEMSTNFEDEIIEEADRLKGQIEEICREVKSVMQEAKAFEELPEYRMKAMPTVVKASRMGEDFRVRMIGLLDSLPQESMTRSKCKTLVNLKVGEFARMTAEAFHSMDKELEPHEDEGSFAEMADAVRGVLGLPSSTTVTMVPPSPTPAQPSV